MRIKTMRCHIELVRDGRHAIIAAALLALTGHATAVPVSLQCTFNKNVGGGERVWVFDAGTRTVDGHPVGEKIATAPGAYNRYFMTDTEIGFATSSGVRHVISRVDGSYTAYGVDGKARWTGTCTPVKQ
jgi:hypothetical protein